METIINNFSKRHQIWRACVKDEVRPALGYIYFEDGFAYASDSHVLVRIPLSFLSFFEPEDTAKLNGHGIYGPAYKLATTLGILQIQECKIESPKGEEEDGVCLVGYMEDCEVRITLTNPSQQKHPNFEPLFKVEGERTPVKRIGLSQKKLGELTAALGTSDVKMEFIDNKRQIFVSPVNEVEASITGIIMPIMLTGTLEGFD